MGVRSATSTILVACVLILLGCGDGEGPATQDAEAQRRTAASDPALKAPPLDIPAHAPRVVFLGDSLSAGLSVQPTQAFPAVLQRRLTEAGTPFHLVNAGVSGSTTAAALERVAWVLKNPADVVIVQLGANDGFRGLSLEETEKSLRAILGRIREAKALPVLLGMKLPPNYGAKYASDFEQLFPRIARELEAVYVPFFLDGVAGIPKLNLADGIHPNPEGHRLIAENLEPHLLKVLSGLR